MLYTYIYVSRCNLQCLEWLLRALGTRIYNQLTTHQSQYNERFTERINIVYIYMAYGIYIKGVWKDIHICKMRGGSVCTRDRASGKHEKRQRETAKKQKIQYN